MEPSFKGSKLEQFIRKHQCDFVKQLYGSALSYIDILEINQAYLLGQLPIHLDEIDPPGGMMEIIRSNLIELNRLGFLIRYGQPGCDFSKDEDNIFSNLYNCYVCRDIIYGFLPKADFGEFKTIAVDGGLIVSSNYCDITYPDDVPHEKYDIPYDPERGNGFDIYRDYITPELYEKLSPELVFVYICHPNPGYHRTDELVLEILEDMRTERKLEMAFNHRPDGNIQTGPLGKRKHD